MNLMYFKLIMMIVGDLNRHIEALYSTQKSYISTADVPNRNNHNIKESQHKFKYPAIWTTTGNVLSHVNSIKNFEYDVTEKQYNLNQQQLVYQQEKIPLQLLSFKVPHSSLVYQQNQQQKLQEDYPDFWSSPLYTSTVASIHSEGYSKQRTGDKYRPQPQPHAAAKGNRLPHMSLSINTNMSFNYLRDDVRYVSENVMSSYDKHVAAPREGGKNDFSQQLLYAPKRSKAEHKVPLPFPPSFITFTTTKPPTAYHSGKETGTVQKYSASKSPRFYVPDYFANRQFKSLLDSYIPSWQVIKMLQHFNLHIAKQTQKVSDLHTLAIAVPFKKNYFKHNMENKRNKLTHSLTNINKQSF